MAWVTFCNLLHQPALLVMTLTQGNKNTGVNIMSVTQSFPAHFDISIIEMVCGSYEVLSLEDESMWSEAFIIHIVNC